MKPNKQKTAQQLRGQFFREYYPDKFYKDELNSHLPLALHRIHRNNVVWNPSIISI